MIHFSYSLNKNNKPGGRKSHQDTYHSPRSVGVLSSSCDCVPFGSNNKTMRLEVNKRNIMHCMIAIVLLILPNE